MVSLHLQDTLAAEEQKLLACIHCGLCLEACPTYVATGDENDGPRGRLYLMRAVGEGRLGNTSSAFKNHIDRCLGCRACEQVCPAGVQYGQLLEAARAELVAAQPPKGLTGALLNFALRHVWTKPTRLRLFFASARVVRDIGLVQLMLRSGLARLFSKRVEFAFALLENSRPASPGANKKSIVSRETDNKSETVLLFTGCVGEGLFGHVNQATTRVLEANGFRVVVPERQVCCGALHAHAGDLNGARELALKNISAFGYDAHTPIITNAGGCGAMLATYGHILNEERVHNFAARVKDVAQQLETAGSNNVVRTSTDVPVTYDASCHLLYGQHAADASLKMIRSLQGLNFVELKGAERCCGGAGIYNLLQPELSGRVLDEKLNAVANTHANVLTTGNPGCQMQIGAGALLSGMKLKVRHPIELLDESYAAAGLYSIKERALGISLNRTVLGIFAPILIIVGVLGFLVPPEMSLTSGATPYNIFHLIFGGVGILILLSKHERAAIGFNVGFGLIDLYQALASFVTLPPQQYFLWTRVDDVLHIIIGLIFVTVGTYGFLSNREKIG